MAKQGMDPAKVKAFAKLADSKATELEGLAKRLSGLLNAVQWTGADATRFRKDWEAHSKDLSTVAASLKDVARIATANANQQESTSA